MRAYISRMITDHLFIFYIVSGGNIDDAFKVDDNGKITVNTGKTLDKATTAAYALQYEVSDGATDPLTAQAMVYVAVGSGHSSGAAVVCSSLLMTVLLFGISKLL